MYLFHKNSVIGIFFICEAYTDNNPSQQTGFRRQMQRKPELSEKEISAKKCAEMRICMKIFYKQSVNAVLPVEEDLTSLNLKDSIEKTRQALEIAYSGFNNAIDADLIDSYIYEINALQKRYHHLTELAEEYPDTEPAALYAHSPIRTLVSHVFG
jgi:hypothetical protein